MPLLPTASQRRPVWARAAACETMSAVLARWRSWTERLRERVAVSGRTAVRRAKAAVPVPQPLRTADRRVLERAILPAFAADPAVRRILFVGCARYTRPYERLFAGREYWTLDADPRLQRYGGRCHVADRLENLARHFDADSFDLIICNGVFGWGLDGADACEVAFDAVYDCLERGRQFVLGWNDVARRRPLALEGLRSLQRFERRSLVPALPWRYPTAGPYRHTYDFYLKPEAG